MTVLHNSPRRPRHEIESCRSDVQNSPDNDDDDDDPGVAVVELLSSAEDDVSIRPTQLRAGHDPE